MLCVVAAVGTTMERGPVALSTRQDRHHAGSVLTAVVVLAAFAAGCGARDTAAPSPLATTPPRTVSPSSSASLPPASASSIPSSTATDGTPPTLIAAGDIGRCDSTHDDATGALAASLVGAVATLGDTAYEDGTAQELTDCFGGSWGAVKDRIRFAVTGNHDIHTDNGAPLQVYMGSAAAQDGHTWFSDDFGTWHVVVLDGNCGLAGRRCSTGSEQEQWLRGDLTASTARCTVALLHQPRFSSGQHGNDDGVRPLWDALYVAGAELVLDGHDHDYERFAPQDPDGTADVVRGIVEIVAGTGGADLEAFNDARPNSQIRINDTYGVLEVTLLADSWSSRFTGVDGAVHDQGSGACH
jgi:hypothetical protein